MNRIRILAAAPQPLYRDAVGRAVRQQARFDLVGEVGDGRLALDELVRLAPDVAVVDTAMPSVDGRRILNAVVRDGLPTRVLLLCQELTPALAYDAIQAGAAGCLSKGTSGPQLCDAIATVAGGEIFLGREAQTGIAEEIRLRKGCERPLLSEREHEVLCRMADGRSAPAIGHAMHLSIATVKTHQSHLYEKLGVSDRAAAVAAAMRRGLLE